MENLIQMTPKELWNRFGFLQNQLTAEYMREKYAQMRHTSEARLLRQAFSIALEQWDDAQIKEFLCKYFFPDLPESHRLAEEASESRRQLFERLHKFIVLGESRSEGEDQAENLSSDCEQRRCKRQKRKEQLPTKESNR